MESDKKLEKLETFLGRLNSKGELIDAKSLHFLVFFLEEDVMSPLLR